MLILFLALFHIVKSNDSRKIVRRNCKQNHTVGFFKRFLPLRKTSVRSKVQVFWEGHYISKQSNLSNSKFLWPSLKTWTLEINGFVLILIELGRQLTVSSIIFWKLDFKCFLVSIYFWEFWELQLFTYHNMYFEDTKLVPHICHSDCA